MGDLVFNGGTGYLNLNLGARSYMYAVFLRKVWYLGWKPTVCRTLRSILHSLNDVIKGSRFETLPSITLKLGSTVFGTGVRICYRLLVAAH